MKRWDLEFGREIFKSSLAINLSLATLSSWLEKSSSMDMSNVSHRRVSEGVRGQDDEDWAE
jgi:hypothetical protein